MHVFKRFLAVSVVALLFSTANAVEITQAPLGNGGGKLSMAPNAGYQVAENFQFANDVSLTKISWWGSYDGSPLNPESFIVRIFEDNGSSDPKTAFLRETGFSGGGSSTAFVDAYNANVYRYDITLPSVLALTGGVDYYLSVYLNDSIGDPDNWYWLEGASGDTTGWSRALDTDSWTKNNQTLNMSYRLTADPVAAVPTPATLLLMLPAMLWFGRRYILKSKD